MKLNDTFLRGLKETGTIQKHSDGGGLYCHVTPKGSTLWRHAGVRGGFDGYLSVS